MLQSSSIGVLDLELSLEEPPSRCDQRTERVAKNDTV